MFCNFFVVVVVRSNNSRYSSFSPGLVILFSRLLISEWIICSSAGTTSGRSAVAQDKGDFVRVTPSLSLI